MLAAAFKGLLNAVHGMVTESLPLKQVELSFVDFSADVDDLS